MLVSSSILNGSEESDLRNKIIEAHRSLQSTIFQGMAVTYSLTNTYAVRTKKTALPMGSVRHVIKQEQTLLIEGTKISGSNPNYSFRIDKKGGKYSLLALESKSSPSERIQSYEASRRAILSSAISFDRRDISELFSNPGTSDLSISPESDRIVVRFSFDPADGEVVFPSVELELDPSNMYQLLKKRTVMRVLATKEELEDETTFTYASQPLEGTEIRMLQRIERITKYETPEGKQDEDLQLSQFADWSTDVPADSQFRLSGYGLPEPDPGALDAKTHWLRWTLTCLVAGLGLAFLFFGKRIPLFRS